ncbi:MAG TPA: NAD-dependent epimerase/dehydratase family protein, partial [Candidatus Omnitrophota bacterium]|nr:NAD-dependent epimerase/dehydratase family protein [Candidatus Omnitrophota bacterium]
MARSILITGGCGFVGSNIAIAFRTRGDRVTCFDNLSRPGSGLLCRRVQEHGCAFVRGDIRAPDDLKKCKGDFSLLIDASAEPSVLAGSDGRDALYVVHNNLTGSVNCFEWCRKRSVAVIFLSTSRVYPYDRINALRYDELPRLFRLASRSKGVSGSGIRPDFPLDGYRSLYGATKLAAEFILREYSMNYNIPAVIDRCGVIAGPWQLGRADQGVFTHWMVSHYFRRRLAYIGFGGTGKQVRDILHIDDLICLIDAQIKVIHKYRGEVFNAGGGARAALSLRQATELCRSITGNTVPIGSVRRNRPADIKWYITDNRQTEQEFAWHPRREAEQT